MKKRISFKLITVVLALVICLVPMLTVIANAKPAKSVPIINIHGLMASDVYVDPNDPDSELAWPPSTDAIVQAVKDVLPSLAKFAVTKDWTVFGDGICDAVNKMFAPIVCNPDGTANGTTGVRFSYPQPSEIKSDSELRFKYDWRLDPVAVAAQLNDYINYVLKCSGSDTVKICCHSLGGVVTNTYLTVYGDSKVSGVCFNSTAIYGQRYIGELMTGQISLDSDALQWFLSYLFDYMEYKNILNTVIDVIRQAGLMDVVVNLGNTIINHLLEQASKEVLAPMFGRWPSIWAMTSDADIEKSEEFMFKYLNTDEEAPILKAKIDYFNENVRPYKTQTLEKLNKHANVYVVSRYGYCSIPITPSFDIVSDGVVDSASTSFGATIAPYGAKLSDEYIANVDPKYISPDKTLDASTCLFPEQTWFIKDMQHANNPDSLDEMMYMFLKYDGQATVDTFDRYPRFNQYDPYNDVISPYTEAEPEATFVERIVLIVKEIIALVVNLFSMISK